MLLQAVDSQGMDNEDPGPEELAAKGGRKRRRRRRRLSDKIRAALARAAALGRRDVTEPLSSLYQATVEEELRRTGNRRRTRDSSGGGDEFEDL